MSKTEAQDFSFIPRSEAFYQALVAQSQELRIILNAQGRIAYVSPNALNFLGHTPSQLAHLNSFAWLHPEGTLRLQTHLQASIRHVPIIFSRLKHERGFWVDCHLLAQKFIWDGLQHGQFEDAWLLTIRKVDGFDCEEASSPPSTTEPLKSNFLAIMSHELRTPINAINGFSQLLLRQRQGELSDEQKDMVERVLTNGKNLLNLINNILDMSKLEAGRMQLLLEDINVVGLIERTVEELSSLATQGGLRLRTEIALSDPIISNDPMRLRQILVNLLSNAIKFTAEGEVWVVVEEMNDSEIWISVQDTGAGIAPGDLPRVFSEFWQVGHLPGQQYQGTGLGLAIAYHLARMMQGDIHVHSQLGQGATFRLVIPRYPLIEPIEFAPTANN